MALITISQLVLSNWQGNSSGIQLRLYATKTFTASSGTVYPRGFPLSASVGGFYRLVACNVNSGSLTIPSFTVDSTTDSLDAPDAQFMAILFDSLSGKEVQPLGSPFALNPSPTSTTWAAIWSAAADI